MRLAFIYPPMLLGARPLDFTDIDGSPRGTTGSEIQILTLARMLAAVGHQVDLYVEGPNASAWEEVCLYPYEMLQYMAASYDTLVVSLDANVFRDLPANPLRVVLQQVNDFSYCKEGFDAFVDLYVSPSEAHRKMLLAGPGAMTTPGKWVVVPNGCFPDAILDAVPKRFRHRAVSASSWDRGLHIALQEWPIIRKAVPDAELRIFYYSGQKWVKEWQDYGPTQASWAPVWQEHSRRARYIGDAISKLKPHGVTVMGPVSRKQMAIEMLSAGVLAFPVDVIAWTEGFSCATMEACALGCLPVLANVDAMGEIYGGSVPIVAGRGKDHAKEWSALVIRAMTDSDWADAYAESARALAEKHDWRLVAKQFETVLGEKLEEKTR